MRKKVIIYTDGSCLGNPGVGGWACLLRYGATEKTLSGGEADTTNNRMELCAAMYALEHLKDSCEVDITTDSQYLKKGVEEWMSGWKKNNWKTAARKPVKNKDLWERIDGQTNVHTIQWKWVKAHAGHRENELVDSLANKAAHDFAKKCKG
jgi:ribonuclease HI